MGEKNLNTTLAHEFKRCKTAWSTYCIFYTLLHEGKAGENIKIGAYDSYVDFASHLYEFYLACIVHDERYPKHPKPDQIDAAMHKEASRLLQMRRDRILRGDAPSWENPVSYYEVQIPDEFGKHFRKVRNLRAHASGQRVTFNLGKFYQDYHRFLYLMYAECTWLWDTDLEGTPKVDWGEIERFSNTIAPSLRKNNENPG